jgi:CDP-diacylglycerol---serine O-phosphatidyltransferase
MKQIPNLFTLLNLFFGCVAIVIAAQSGLMPVYDINGLPSTDAAGNQFINLPERIWLSSIFIFLAAIVDFLDGFLARLFKAESALGASLDSLSDVVSFGVAPSVIVYQFLRLSWAQQENGLDVSSVWLWPSFLIALAAAFRLARFNTDSTEKQSFRGLPVPSVGLLIASFPLIYWVSYKQFPWVVNFLINKWFWYGIIVFISWLMISDLPMLALKFSRGGMKKLQPFIILAIITIVGFFLINWLIVPLSFLAYILLSLTFKNRTA